MGYQPPAKQIQAISGALIAFYRKRWCEWGQSDDRQLLDHIYVTEFRAAGCDIAELFEAFVEVNRALERQAYGAGHERHFGIAYLAKSPVQDRGLIRAIIMVEPEAIKAFAATAETMSQRPSGLSVSRCEIDPNDPDAHWRWLADGIQASTTMFEHGGPLFVQIGTGRNSTSRSVHMGTVRISNSPPAQKI